MQKASAGTPAVVPGSAGLILQAAATYTNDETQEVDKAEKQTRPISTLHPTMHVTLPLPTPLPRLAQNTPSFTASGAAFESPNYPFFPLYAHEHTRARTHAHTHAHVWTYSHTRTTHAPPSPRRPFVRCCASCCAAPTLPQLPSSRASSCSSRGLPHSRCMTRWQGEQCRL